MVNSSVNIKRFLCGVFSILFGILSLIWSPYNLALEERLRMRPGLPPFEWWYNPPDVNRLKVYFFNITNAESFLSGEDAKLKMEEVGPIILKEVIKYSDVAFNDNGTLSYTARRMIIYDSDLNTIDLNTTLTVPNMAALLAVSYFWDAAYLVKVMMNLVLERMVKTIVRKTLYEILYNNTDPFLSLGHTFMRSMVIYGNLGLLPLMNRNQTTRITVYIGTKFGHQKFFLIDKYNGSSYIPSNSNCKHTITDAADSIIYSQLVPKSRKVKYFYDLVCKPVTFLYQDEVYMYGLKGYRYVLPGDDFNRTKPPENDCFKGTPTLPNGLIDLSSCWDSYPIVISFPHFLYGDPKLLTYVDGMKPNATLHASFSLIEPVSGVNLDFIARVQININVKPLQGFHKMFDKFSNMIVPTFYVEKYAELPLYIIVFIYFIHLLPILGSVISATTLLLGVYCLWKCAREAHDAKILPNRIQRRIDGCVPEGQAFLNVAR
ncbi:SCRB7 [Trypoxylus dichotomus]